MEGFLEKALAREFEKQSPRSSYRLHSFSNSEEFGAIMIFFIILIFLIFLYKTFKNISYLKNDKIKFIIFGCSIIIFFQFLVHLGVNIRILPTTGMTLPFLSYGGSSIVGSSILAESY